MYSKLQYISQGATPAKQIENIQHVLDGGGTWIQLRFKNATERELYNVAEKVKIRCDAYKATFIVNDHVHVAKNIDASGVHVGLNDTSPQIARTILGTTKIIGGTANTLSDVLKRVNEKCSYIGLGPFRFTTTKEKLSPILGLDGYEKIMEHLKNNGIRIPVYAIGGILADDIDKIMTRGVYGICMSGQITHHPDKKVLLEQLTHKLYATTQNRQ